MCIKLYSKKSESATKLLEQGPAATGKAAILADRQFGEDEEIRWSYDAVACF